MELTRPSLRKKLWQLQRCSICDMFFLGLYMMLENSQRFFDKFEKSEDGSINQEEFMKALAEERNLVDILTQNGRCYQGMDL